MDNEIPDIKKPIANMEAWSGNLIDSLSNLQSRKIYMEVGSVDVVVGPNPMHALQSQLANFDTAADTTFVTTVGAGHTFPTDFNSVGDNLCSDSVSPFISNCGYDGAGAVLQWMVRSILDTWLPCPDTQRQTLKDTSETRILN